MDFSSKYVIVGFPKCGQMSLEKYFIDKGFDIKRHDIIWREKAPEIIRTHDLGRIPIIITRDPIEMIWSSYNYWPYHDSMSFERYLRHRTVRESNLGHENPIEHADYKKHIKRFKDMNPI